jgi:tetratricopeptide (TPR) repeat protein
MLTGTLSTEQLEAAIAQIDARLGRDAPSVSLYFDRGQFLEMLGRKDEAVEAYINVLRTEPTHVDALNSLGLLFLAVGNREGARTLLSGAVLHGPQHASAHANLAYLDKLDNHPTGARALYERALELDPTLAIAHHGLADLLPEFGDDAGAAEHRSLGLRYRPITIERYIGEGRPVNVLALGTASIGNVPTDGIFDNRVFRLASLTVEYDDPSLPLPPHDIVFNAIGEGDLCADALVTASAIVSRTTAPIINRPAAVAATSRASNARRLGQIEGIVTPRMTAVARSVLAGPAAQSVLSERGFTYPLLVRSPGYHTGDHFSKVDRAEDLSDTINALPGNALLVIQYLDLRDARGHFRKYRAIIVDARLYPLHLAISRAWKVHYFSAAMAESLDNRAEDAAFLTDMAAVLGAPAFAALERVRDTLALDYGGIDFAIDGDGNVIVFEANASMIVPTPGPEAIWNYRREPVARIRTAVREMLVGRATEDASVLPTVSETVDGQAAAGITVKTERRKYIREGRSI